jgi:hypothetical protein
MADYRRVALVDLDGTLLFTEDAEGLAAQEVTGRRLRRSSIRKLDRQTKHMIYSLAQSKYADKATPNEKLKKRLSRIDAANIVILTARHSDTRRHTVMALKKHGIVYGKLLCRSGKAKELDDEEWKLRVLKRYARAYGRVELYDDKADNLKYMRDRIGMPNVSFIKVSEGSITGFPKRGR